MNNIGNPLENKFWQLGKEVPQEDLIDVFPAKEGEGNLYYGLIGSGKTYGATVDAIDDAKRGAVVYTTWPIKVDDFDDRESFFMVCMNILLFRKRFYQIPLQKNIHYINAEKGEVDGVPTFNPDKPSDYIDFLNTLTHCVLYIDEAWRVIDSYKGTNFSIGGRDLVLVTRHKFRTVNLIAQRPTSVHVSARGNMNRFFKFVKIASWPWIRFARYEFQEMSGETVNEEADPISVKTYWGSKKIFNAYNSWQFDTQDRLHALHLKAFDLTFFDKLKAFFAIAFPKKRVKIKKPDLVDQEIPF